MWNGTCSEFVKSRVMMGSVDVHHRVLFRLVCQRDQIFYNKTALLSLVSGTTRTREYLGTHDFVCQASALLQK